MAYTRFGRKVMRLATLQVIGQRCAVVLDNEFLSLPVIVFVDVFRIILKSRKVGETYLLCYGKNSSPVHEFKFNRI